VWSSAVAGAVVVCLASAASAATASAAAGNPSAADAKLKAIYTADEAWRLAQRGAGDPSHPERILPELPYEDVAHQQLRLTHDQQVMHQLAALDAAKLSPAERINFEVFREQLAVRLDDLHFREYEKPANSDSTFWSGEEMTVQKPFRTADDYRRYIAQLGDIPRYFDENIANMRAGLARHFTAPRVTLAGRDHTITPVAEAATPEATVYYKPFLTMPASIPAAQQAALRAEAAQVIATRVQPEYRKLLAFWRDTYFPNTQTSLAATDLPDGEAYYAAQIRQYTTLSMTPAAIQALGLSEMAKIHAEMLQTMQDAGFHGTLPEFLHFLRTDPQFYAKSPDELLMRAAWIAKQFDGVADKYFGYMPRHRFGIVPVPPEIAPFYTSARGGEHEYYVNTYDLPSRGLYSLPALTLHESAPGHSWQLGIALEHQNLPKFRNAYISAYGEGWALYCERLGDEMGMYHTPYERFGMLSYQAWRAARLVVDTGIHAQGWTREQAQQYLRENTALSDHEIETEVDRYISWPGQALSYYLGELEILKLRHKAETALGPRFNLCAFHDVVLSTGSVPLPVLDEVVESWIAGGGVGPYPEMEK
jgi:uncharacterized protein (DUF885 family)